MTDEPVDSHKTWRFAARLRAIARASYADALAIAISSIAMTHYLWLITRPNDVMVRYIPDDAFYELQIARHFLATGRWSFDGGLTTTTGFHLLNVYLMSLFPQLLAHPMFAARFWMGVGVALSIASAFVICRFAERTFGAFALMPVFLILTARYIVLGNISLLEFPFVLLIAALYVSAVVRDHETVSRRALAIVFALGLVGSLARSDFGGLPLVLAGACAIRWAWNRRRDYVVPSMVGLVGATAGLAMVCLHDFMFSGHFLSGSAMTKAVWGQRAGFTMGPAFSMSTSAIVSSPSEFTWIAWIIEAGILLCFAKDALRMIRGGESRNENSDVAPGVESFWICTGLSGVVLYTVVYGFDPVAFQPWYLANFVMPMVLALGAASAWIQLRPLMQAAAAIAMLAVLSPQLRGPYDAPWPWQSHMYEMGKYLQQHPVEGRIAGWNVGVVGYLLDGQVINLDGLANNEVFPYIRASEIEKYIGRMRIDYIADYPEQLQDPAVGKLYGYDGARLATRLIPIYKESDGAEEDRLFDDTLYRVKR